MLVRLLQDNPGNRSPVKVLLCDMNIWWRVAKGVYNREHAASPVCGALPDICPVYGIWHTYKACVSALYKAFSPSLICLEYDCFLMDPTATRVYRYPPLIALERLILSCYLVYPALQSQFDRGNNNSGVSLLTVKLPYGRSTRRLRKNYCRRIFLLSCN